MIKINFVSATIVTLSLVTAILIANAAINSCQGKESKANYIGLRNPYLQGEKLDTLGSSMISTSDTVIHYEGDLISQSFGQPESKLYINPKEKNGDMRLDSNPHPFGYGYSKAQPIPKLKVHPHGKHCGCALTDKYSPALGCPNPNLKLIVTSDKIAYGKSPVGIGDPGKPKSLHVGGIDTTTSRRMPYGWSTLSDSIYEILRISSNQSIRLGTAVAPAHIIAIYKDSLSLNIDFSGDSLIVSGNMPVSKAAEVFIDWCRRYIHTKIDSLETELKKCNL